MKRAQESREIIQIPFTLTQPTSQKSIFHKYLKVERRERKQTKETLDRSKNSAKQKSEIAGIVSLYVGREYIIS